MRAKGRLFMLQLQHIHKSYTTGDFTQIALNDISVSFRDNEFVAILGPSGSGKTTLLNIVGGLDHYDYGDLIIDGISTKEYKDRDWDTFRNNRVGFVFQSYNLIPHQTILANVELALTLSGVSREERQERAKKALEEVGLGEHINKKPSQLSGGQMQRVAIARALINDPEILLADEPTGALDSKTSVQIMDLLTEIAKDRLVVMVTHNPELAQQYATRIVNLTDGVITSDSDPFIPTEEDMRLSEKPIRKTRMSFLTALGLSFNNLMTKKGRTIMTAFAGSIGIIGIAAILALANGVNSYIANVEEETLSEYPLQIQSTGFDMTSMMIGTVGESSDTAGDNEDKDSGEDTVHVVDMITNMLSSVASNDLASLKAYFDSGQSGIEQYTSTIEYTYNVVPQIYSSDTEDIHQVNPDKSFSSLGLGSTTSSNSIMSASMSTNVFYEMPSDPDLYENQYDVKAGRWPENYNECVLVLTGNGGISDFMLYSLGLRDSEELNTMVSQFADEEEVTIPTDITDPTYDQILDVKFKLVNACDYYEYDSAYDVWRDKTDNESYMRNLVDNGEDVSIVGIVQPKEGTNASMLSAGINYPASMIDHIIEKASQSQIVQDQLADSSIDVFTGKAFGEEDEGDSNFSMDSLFTIDGNAISAAFTIDENALTAGLGNMDLDLSNVNIDMSSLPAFDASSIQIDPTQIDPETFTNMSFDLSGISLNDKVTVDPEPLTKAMKEVVSGFWPWYAQQAGGDSDFNAALNTYLSSSDVQEIINNSVESAVNVSGLEEDIASQVQQQVGNNVALQIQSQISSALQTAVQKQLESAMSQYMTQAISTTMSQFGTALEQQVGGAMQLQMAQLATNMASAMNVDPDVFANAFQSNMDEEDLGELMMSMMTGGESTYDSNLRELGYADKSEPSGIDIYPINFESKEHVIEILDNYNTQMEEQDEDDKVITYTDIVGTLMASVTTIVDMISYVLVAFVSISLVVSSIMIGVITYISVLERRKEIGILRAIGASKKDISHVFNAETIIEGLISGLLGVGITALLCIPASAIIELLFDVPNIASLPIGAAVVLVLISVFLTFIAGLIPSSSASRKDPVEALRSE